MTYLLAIISILLPTYLVRFEVLGVPSTLLEVLIWAAFVMGVVLAVRDRSIVNRIWERRVWLLPATLIAAGAIIGIVIAPDTRVALGLFKGFILDPILVYMLALAFVNTQYDARWIAWGLLGGAGLVAAWSLLDAAGTFALREGILSAVEGFSSGRVIGPYALDANASPNYLAFALAPVLPLVAWLAAIREISPNPSLEKRGVPSFTKGGLGRISMALVGLVAILIILALYASGSRAGFVAGLGGLVFAVVLSGRLLTTYYIRLTKWLVVGLLALCALSWFAVRPNFSLTPEEGGRITASNNVRWQLWSATGELVQQDWLFGTGLGGFQQRFDELTQSRVNYPEFITPRARTPHNLLVGMWMETGLLGLMGMFIVFVLVGRALFGALRLRSGQVSAAALLGTWFVLFAHGLVDHPIWKNDTMVVFWLLVALCMVLEQKKQTAVSS